jgi:hypothetical protein
MPFRSPDTRFDASDSNAIARTKRLSFDMTAFVEDPFGAPPPVERDTTAVDVLRAVVTLVSGRAPALTSAATTTAKTAAATTYRPPARERRLRESTGRWAPGVRQVLRATLAGPATWS